MAMYVSMEGTNLYFGVRQSHANNRTNEKSAKAKEAIHHRQTAAFN